MNKLILIGNGFDLAHGLKTSYCDFILWYLNKSWVKFKKQYPFEDNLMSMNLINYNADGNDFTSINQFLEKKKHFKIDFKHTFFEQIINNGDQYGWVDIETKYYGNIVSLYKRLETNNFTHKGHHVILNELLRLNSCFNSIKHELIEYLNTTTSTPEISSEIHSHIWKGINLTPEKKIRPETSKKTARRNLDNHVYFLNFNYTSAIDLYINNIPNSLFTINYIHGRLNDVTNPIIFGYGDEMHQYYEKIEQLDEDEYLRNIKSFGYFQTDNYKKFTDFIGAAPFQTVIMGHSCGLSDRILLNSIFEHENCKKIEILYYQKTNSENDYFEKTQKISRHFRASMKGKMRTKIVPYTESLPLIKFKGK